MFQFFFRQLSTGLKGTDSPYFNQYIYLLESLSTIKSVVLVCDLPNADELTNEVFRIFFDLVRCQFFLWPQYSSKNNHNHIPNLIHPSTDKT